MARDLLWGLMARESECKLCGRRAKAISGFLGICGDCAKRGSDEALRIALEAHARSRARFGLPPRPPKDPSGIGCGWCGNDCRIGEGGRGFCGLVENRGGRLARIAGTPEGAIVSAYLDPHPTNCVAAWACAGGSGAGYPKYSLAKGPEYGFYNLAVFYGACSYDCLYCQNWHFREMIAEGRRMSSEELASKAGPKVTCICFFGGDPTPQIHHAIEAAKIARRRRDRPLRICLETNGNMASGWLDEIARISWESGGGIKFDLKCHNESLHIALTGVSNRQALENLRRLSGLHKERPEVPFIRASTLLVPGYVDEEEVRGIAEYLASVDPTIPYSLLAYSPQFEMDDLPLTPAKLAEACKRAAEGAGLERVNIGNRFLLAP